MRRILASVRTYYRALAESVYCCAVYVWEHDEYDWVTVCLAMALLLAAIVIIRRLIGCHWEWTPTSSQP
jgi:hypothetical protein